MWYSSSGKTMRKWFIYEFTPNCRTVDNNLHSEQQERIYVFQWEKIHTFRQWKESSSVTKQRKIQLRMNVLKLTPKIWSDRIIASPGL